MAYIEDGGPAGRAGIFYRIAFYVEEMQFTLQTLNRMLPNHWPFISIKRYLGDVGWQPTGINKWLGWLVATLWKADTWAKPLVDDIAERLRERDLDGLIESYAPGVWSFFQDPKGKVKDYLKDWSRTGYDLFREPLKELNDWLEDNYPVLWAFKKDPKQYILDKLKEQHTELYNFALDPLGWIGTNIGDVLDEVRWFIRDPYHFVHWYLLKMDSPLAPFWADPGEWVIDHLLDWAVEAVLRDWRS